MTSAPGRGASGPLQRPVFLMSTPRSGSTLLFQTLILSPDACSIGNESHALFEGIRALHPAAKGCTSNRLDVGDATPPIVAELSRRFDAALIDRKGAPATACQRMIEKTPKNALRVPFLAAAFPGASFVFLRRAARPTLSSMMEAWQSGRFRTYPHLPGWSGLPWSLLLVPGWRDLAGKPLEEIVAGQWATTTQCLIDDLARLPSECVCAISYEEFVASPQALMERLCARLGLGWDRTLSAMLPVSRTTVSAPGSEKWRRHEATIETVWPLVEEADARAAAFLGDNSVS